MTATLPVRDPHEGGGDGAGIPRHVAIIMDGNGRWAKARNLPRSVGHERGVEALRRTVEAARDIGITCLTVYSFSTENWRRPMAEVNTLFGLLKAYVKRDLNRLAEGGVRITILGTREGLPEDILSLCEEAETRTRHNAQFELAIAFNYGAREEMARAVRAIAEKSARGEIDATEITEDVIEAHLDTARLPDPDLIIRTSGEHRLSNFLLWQGAYSELVFTDVFWPDFGESDLRAAVETFRARERRFGGLRAGSF